MTDIYISFLVYIQRKVKSKYEENAWRTTILQGSLCYKTGKKSSNDYICTLRITGSNALFILEAVVGDRKHTAYVKELVIRC